MSEATCLLGLPPLSADDKDFNIEQLRLYAQLLTAIFSIYFATIGIILDAGYTRLRRDIIQMLTNEQVGSVYSRVLVLAAIFCLSSNRSCLLVWIRTRPARLCCREYDFDFV